MKKYWPLIPALVFPYLVLLAMFLIYHGYLGLFHDDAYLLLLWLVIVWFVGLIGDIAVFRVSLVKKRDAHELARVAMTIKLAQIPAYTLIFLIGLACLITIFTYIVSVALVLLDGMAILLSGLVGLAAVKRSYGSGVLTKEAAILHGILQFVFCLDVVSAMMVYRKTKPPAKKFAA